MDWINFPLYSYIAAALWTAGTFLALFPKKGQMFRMGSILFTIAGLIVFGFFIGKLWLHLERPPLRTLGETRLWYTFFLFLVGLIGYIRWKYIIFQMIGFFFGILFLLINLLHPEGYEKTLMPALQSAWFAPHVIVYILSYAILLVSSVLGAWGLFTYYFSKFRFSTLQLADNLVYIGFSFLTLGLLFGALWAKEAWGHYWTWDPKETWALLTWLTYLIYMHFRTFQPKRIKAPLWTLSLAYIVLLICYMGINYLPSAQNSVHVYSGN